MKTFKTHPINLIKVPKTKAIELVKPADKKPLITNKYNQNNCTYTYTNPYTYYNPYYTYTYSSSYPITYYSVTTSATSTLTYYPITYTYSR